MTIVSHYTRRHKRRLDDLVSVALLCLTESIPHAANVLTDNNLGAFLTTTISHAINRYITEDVMIRIPQSSKHHNDLSEIRVGSLSNKIFRESKDGFEDARDPKLEAALAAPSGKGVECIWERLWEIAKTGAERQFLTLRAQGHTNREIAATLGVSEKAVSVIRKHLERGYYGK